MGNHEKALSLRVTLLVVDPRQSSEPPAELSAYYETQPELAALYARSRQLEPLTQNVGFGNRGPSEQALLYGIADVDERLSVYAGTNAGNEQENYTTKRRRAKSAVEKKSPRSI